MKFPNYLFGLITGFSFGCLCMILPSTISSAKKLQKPQSTFEIVNTYKGCDIVKMNDQTLYEPQYFMRCPK